MPDRPNVLVVTVDSLRADHVDGRLASTPAMDRLATDGTAFKNAYAQGPFTTFSMPSLFTSRYPSQLTSIDFVEGVEGVLVEGVPTVQQRLRDAGYTTAGIQTNPLLSETFGFDVGFDQFLGGSDTVNRHLPERLTLLWGKLRRLFRRTPYVPADELTDRALDWLRKNDEEPFFLWVHYMDVHGPYQPRGRRSYREKYRAELLWRKAVNSPGEVTPEERERLRETYVDEVEFTDGEFGRLVDGLAAEEQYDDSLVVLTADHGDEFHEHGSYSHESKLYDELVHVPLLVKPPNSRSVGAPDDDIVPLLDVAPTVLDVADADGAGLEGLSLLASNRPPGGSAAPGPDQLPDDLTVDGEGATLLEAPAVVSEARLGESYTGSVRTASWKYIHTPDGPELYDLDADPSESANLAGEQRTVEDALATRLQAHRERTTRTHRDGAHLDTGELDERLRSLGYLE